MSQATLFDSITVHCFTCRHTVEGATPNEAHDLMESHYEQQHRVLIDRLVAGVCFT